MFVTPRRPKSHRPFLPASIAFLSSLLVFSMLGVAGAGAQDDTLATGNTSDAAWATADSLSGVMKTADELPDYANPAVAELDSVTPDVVGGWNDATSVVFSETSYPGSLTNVKAQIGAWAYWAAGFRGDGIDIAIIDSGVVPVPGLSDPEQIINGPDLSFESQVDPLRYMDTFGHGTHLAGIMVGNSVGTKGIAPDARLVSLKVAAHDGAVDVTQVIAAIDWVVQHRNDGDLNIRVLNLSYGTQSTNAYESDALAHAVQQAWEAGIVVVAAAGNDGPGVSLRSPSYNPSVIAVGAVDGSLLETDHDPVAAFSSCGTDQRNVDVVAPGRSIVSYRSPGSFADVHYPRARVGSNLFMGSGTSQATAVVSGAAALILDQRPDLTPDQVKALLIHTATDLPQAGAPCAGAGLINLAAVRWTPAGSNTQSHAGTEGDGPLDGTRGGAHVAFGDHILKGNYDIFGAPLNPSAWARLAEMGATWQGGAWNSNVWAGADWSGYSWTHYTWESVSWNAPTWTGHSWSGDEWSGGSWSGGSWSGGSWSGGSWSGGSWSGGSWSGGSWS